MPAKKSKPDKATKPRQKPKVVGAKKARVDIVQPKNSILASNLLLYITIGVIIIGIVGYFAWTKYQDTQEENVRIEHLTESGIALDKVKKSLDESGIDAQVKRLSYCWRTGEKTGPGFRYCDQRLVVYGTNKTETEQLKGIDQAVTSLGGVVDVASLGDQVGTYKEGRINAYKVLSGNGFFDEKKVRCGVKVMAVSPDDSSPLYAGTYQVDMTCSSPISSKDIYPKGDALSADSIFEK